MSATKHKLMQSFKWSIQLDVNGENECFLFTLCDIKHTVVFEFEFHI
jgi:hypothetical protein